MTAEPELIVERRRGAGWIRFNRPAKLNALSHGMLRALAPAWQELDTDPAVHAIVVTGTGRGFCVGADLAELATDRDGHEDFVRAAQENRRQLTGVDFGVLKPVICAVNGVCAGGGLHFVVDADLVIAATSAKFIDPHVSAGQVSGAESVALRLRMPFGEALRFSLLGSAGALSAERAYTLGLVGELVPDTAALETRAQEIAESFARSDQGRVAAVKRSLWEQAGHVPPAR
jgi:enoyl-CoA hydratase/carnithine racemase